MKKTTFMLMSMLFIAITYGQDRKKNENNQEPYFHQIVEKKQQEIDLKIKENGGNTKGVGLKSFNRWRAFWEPRIGKYGKFSDANKYIQSTIVKNNYSCNSLANWNELGPTKFPSGNEIQRGLGRLNFVKLHPSYNGTSNQTLYAGGIPGLWKSTNNGDSWTNMNSDKFEIAACSDVAVMENLLGTEILLAATGVRKNRLNPTRSSIGLKRSTNGGSTWTTVNLEATPWEIGDENQITEIAVDPNANNRVYVSVTQFSWGAGPDYFGTTNVLDNYIGKLYVSENYGLTWTKIYEGFAIEDIEFKTNDSNTFYFSGHKLVKGTRLGINNYTFTDLSAGLSGYGFNEMNWNNGISQFMQLEVTKDNPNVIYVFSMFYNSTYKQRLWKSTDGGISFTLLNSGSFPYGIGWIRGILEVSQQDENLVYITGIYSGRSTDGGVSWTNLSGIHVDTNDVEVSNTDQVFLANDAGVYRSLDNGLTWQIASEDLGVSEVWDIGMSLRTNTSVPDIIEAGFQDTNCMVRLSNGNWTHSSGTSGDGLVCIVDPVDPNIVYSEAQGGVVRRSTNGGLNFSGYNVGGGPGGGPGGGLFLTPMVLDPNNHDRLLVGKSHIRVRVAGGATTQLTIPFSVATSQKISALKVAPSNSNIIYAAYEIGIPDFDSINYSNFWKDPNRKMREQLLKTTDGGITWTDVSPTELTKGSHGTISSIEVHSSDPDKIWVTYQTYSSKHHVITSDNGGNDWANYSQGLEKVPVNDIIITPTHNNSVKRCDFLYLATDFGVYYRTSSMSQWECYNDGVPNVAIMDLEIDEYQNILRCATYGRGVWQTGLHPDDYPYNNSNFTFVTSCASDGTTNVIVTPNDPSPNQWWGLFETSSPNQTAGSHTIAQVGNTQCCGAGTKTFTGLDPNKYYYIKHGVWDECHSWQETRKYIPSINESSQSVFHFEDVLGQSKTVFCAGEDIYLNGIASQGESQYFLDLKRRPIGSTGAFSNYADYGWTPNQQVGVINLSYEFLNNGHNPGEEFISGYEYEVRLAISNPPCTNWIPAKKILTVVSCRINKESTINSILKDDEDSNIYSVTPNPSKGIFTLNSLKKMIGNLEVYDQKGSLILEYKVANISSFLIDLSKYSAGLYYLKLTIDNNVIVKRLIKQ